MARKILLADDSVTAQNMGRKILSDAGYDVATVNNGSAALKRVAEQKPDLIVLDVYMPGYSGLEVCQRLKDSPETADIPILLTVGKLEPFKPEEARRVRAEAYIVKPFEASELLSVLTRLEDQVVPGGKNGKESHGDTETGWKNRLRFPAKKKKEEPEPEPDMDFTAGTAAARSSRRGKAPGPEAVPAAEKAIPDIPRDITPEELDALSALAAKLDAPQNAAPSEAKKEFEIAKPAVEESAAAPAIEAPRAAEESKTAAEIPADKATAAVDEGKQPEMNSVNVAELAEKEAAPVDREDEPIFSAAPAPTAPIAAERETAKVETKEKPAAAVEASTPAEAVEPVIAQSNTAQSNTAQAKTVQAKSVQAKSEEPKVEEVPAPAQAVSEEKNVEPPKVEAPVSSSTSTPTQEQPEPVPSEEELAEALRLLTPATVEASSARAEATLAVGGSAAAAGQWTAVAVALDPAEAACSLEAEMFKTLGTAAAVGEPAASSAGATESKTTAMAAAAAASSSGSSMVATTPTGLVEAPPAGHPSKEKIADATVGDEQAPATFADAVGQTDEPVVAGSTVTETAGKDSQTESDVPVTETATVSSSKAAAGVEEDMGNERGKNKKSNTHQNRSTEADAVETAKQVVVEEAKKAMAAAAQGAAADSAAIANIVDSVLADLRPKIVEEISKKLSGK